MCMVVDTVVCYLLILSGKQISFLGVELNGLN